LSSPDSGAVANAGTCVPLLDLGGGMHPDLTGRENAWVRGRLLGVDGPALHGLFERIIEFAGIGSSIDEPVRYYSSGMAARLGFAVAIHCPGDVLLVDELLAVGDEEFRRRAVLAMDARRREGAAVLFVSHELQLIEQTCQRAIRLHRGRIVDDGPVGAVIDAYGGAQLRAGVEDAVSGIQLPELHLAQRSIPIGGTLVAEGRLVVEEAVPNASLEVAYRAVPEDRSAPMELAQRDIASFYRETLEPPGDLLARPGTYRYRLVVENNQLSGAFDVVMSVVDRAQGSVLAEHWQEVVVGHENPERMLGFVARIDWTVEPDGDAAR
jgi:ABC-type multidrug transport system ATPase subunit